MAGWVMAGWVMAGYGWVIFVFHFLQRVDEIIKKARAKDRRQLQPVQVRIVHLGEW